MKNGLKALIFDVDGTLADNERDGHRIAFNLAFRDAGTATFVDVAFLRRIHSEAKAQSFQISIQGASDSS